MVTRSDITYVVATAKPMKSVFKDSKSWSVMAWSSASVRVSLFDMVAVSEGEESCVIYAHRALCSHQSPADSNPS